MTFEQKQKLQGDYVRARDEYQRALEQVRRDREKFIRLGLMPGDIGNSEK
jgi:hypothetical protein